jgi:hypothetical protein
MVRLRGFFESVGVVRDAPGLLPYVILGIGLKIAKDIEIKPLFIKPPRVKSFNTTYSDINCTKHSIS